MSLTNKPPIIPRAKKGAFTRFAEKIAWLTGHPAAFLLAFSTVIVWGITGPLFGFSDTWQLVINTGTTIITFLMVFLIQNTQNRDILALHLKLDELIRSHRNANTALLDMEELSEGELTKIRTEYEDLAAQARKADRKARKGHRKAPA